MVINIEWGNFGADGKIDDFLTEFDRAVDADSIHPKNAMCVHLIDEINVRL